MLADVESASMEGTGRGDVPPGARAAAWPAVATVPWFGTYGDATDTFRGSYELLTGGPHAESSYQQLRHLKVRIRRHDDPADPERDYLEYLTLGIETEKAIQLAVPRERIDLEHAYCFSDLIVRFHSTDAHFFKPRVGVNGTHDKPDFEGAKRNYNTWASGWGIPREEADASDKGAVALTLPAGEYRLDPAVTFVNPGGGTSDTDLRGLDLHLGCRQVIHVLPEIGAQVVESPDCAGSTPARITGRVTAEDEIAAITWSVNGSPPTDACRPCGRDPEYTIDFLSPGGSIEVVVTALDVAGRESSVSVVAGHADEPSALDVEPRAEPLRVHRDGDTTARFTWAEAAGNGYALYGGSLDDLWQTRRLTVGDFAACGVGAPTWTGEVPTGNTFFLVTSGCEFGDASLGRDSAGTPRPPSTPRCH
jgi:hypothetical protein